MEKQGNGYALKVWSKKHIANIASTVIGGGLLAAGLTVPFTSGIAATLIPWSIVAGFVGTIVLTLPIIKNVRVNSLLRKEVTLKNKIHDMNEGKAEDRDIAKQIKKYYKIQKKLVKYRTVAGDLSYDNAVVKRTRLERAITKTNAKKQIYLLNRDFIKPVSYKALAFIKHPIGEHNIKKLDKLLQKNEDNLPREFYNRQIANITITSPDKDVPPMNFSFEDSRYGISTSDTKAKAKFETALNDDQNKTEFKNKSPHTYVAKVTNKKGLSAEVKAPTPSIYRTGVDAAVDSIAVNEDAYPIRVLEVGTRFKSSRESVFSNKDEYEQFMEGKMRRINKEKEHGE